MDNALLVGLSRQVALQRQLDVIANNLANIDTNGFKGESVQFEEYLSSPARANAFQLKDQRVSFVQDRSTLADFSQGPLTQTGNALDIAIAGPGFLAVDTPTGERYTRNGALALNPQGELVTHEGYKVLGANGPIQFDQNDTNVVIARDGSISALNSNQTVDRGKVRLVNFADTQRLTKQGASLYSSGGQQAQATTATTYIVQGSIEKSNVQPVVEMSRMIEVSRAYTTLANLLTRTDDLRNSAINKLADTSSS
ncbi:MAG TPA: flagellar basal-body rod protein FlgF [Xanthobacteraceae bacterium]|nr:flagellar basal-body rod protein FlgF [Xanthobacteraceae bacterium]